LRLNPYFRWTVYGAFTVLVATGIVWMIADQFKDGANGDLWQAVGANLLMLHGGAAMATLLFLGALFPLHMQRGWRARKNRITGVSMATFNAILVATAFGLYYLGSETLRPWISDAHIAVGVVLPALFVVHVLSGRRAR
jgi:cation transport ATPase